MYDRILVPLWNLFCCYNTKLWCVLIDFSYTSYSPYLYHVVLASKCGCTVNLYLHLHLVLLLCMYCTSIRSMPVRLRVCLFA